MLRKIVACLMAGLLLVSVLPRQQPPEKKPAEKPAEKPADKPVIDPAIQKLVDQLADLDFHTRDAAARKLEAMGTKVIPALRAARKHSDPEVRRRAAELLDPIESATLFAPKRITLQVEKKTAADAIAEIAKASGYPIDIMPGAVPPGGKAEEKFTFQWKDVPFWQAVDDVCRAGGFTVYQNFGDTRLHLQAQGRSAPYVCQAGAFCLTAGGFQETKTVDFSTFPRDRAAVNRTDDLVLAFYVHAEPRLPLLRIHDPHITAAYDDEGNSMVAASGGNHEQLNPQLFGYRNGPPNYGANRMLTLCGHMYLVRPSARATALKQIKGTIPVTVLLEQKAETVTDKLATAKGKKFTVGTTSFTIEDLSETPTKQPQLRMTIIEDANVLSGPNDYFWMNSLWSRLEVYDEKGARLNNNGSSWGGAGPNHVNMTMTYAVGNKPSKLVYHQWTLANCNLAFEFKGLPLP